VDTEHGFTEKLKAVLSGFLKFFHAGKLLDGKRQAEAKDAGRENAGHLPEAVVIADVWIVVAVHGILESKAADSDHASRIGV
jgi:hypothetical protein